jgi:hypothetical protein
MKLVSVEKCSLRRSYRFQFGYQCLNVNMIVVRSGHLKITVEGGKSMNPKGLRSVHVRNQCLCYLSLLIDPLPSAIVMRHDYSFTVHQIVLSVDEFSIRR